MKPNQKVFSSARRSLIYILAYPVDSKLSLIVQGQRGNDPLWGTRLPAVPILLCPSYLPFFKTVPFPGRAVPHFTTHSRPRAGVVPRGEPGDVHIQYLLFVHTAKKSICDQGLQAESKHYPKMFHSVNSEEVRWPTLHVFSLNLNLADWD